MQLGLVSTDLMLASRLAGVATALELRLVTAGSASVALDWNAAETAVGVVDLRTVGSGIRDFAAAWHSASDSPPLVACGPHVHEQLLAAAQAAGCAAVVTRGQFDRDAEQILRAVLQT